jgi:hypothetical protein
MAAELSRPGPGARADLSTSLRSIAWQASGSIATLAAALWVSWRFGLAAQGEFGLARSWFDAAAALACFGVPQGVLHVLYRLGAAPGPVRALLLRGWVALFVAAALAAGLLWGHGLALAALVVATAPVGAAHLCARSFVLAQRGVVAYGAATALPALLVLAAVVMAGLLAVAPDFGAWLAAAIVAAAAISVSFAWRAATVVASSPAGAIPLRALRDVSLQSWLQAALAALLGAALLGAIAALGQRGEALGMASLGLHVYQACVVLAGYVTPLLFDRWARERAPEASAWLTRARRPMAVATALAAAALAVALWAPALAPWLVPAALMGLAGLAAMAARLVGTVLLARGAYVELTVQALCRLLVALGVLVAALPWFGAASALAIALLVIELGTWWRAAAVARRSAAP